MSLPESQQTLSIIHRSSGVLLVVPEKPSADAFASMVATYLTLLEHYKGNVDAVSPSHVPQQLQFLSGSSQVKMQPAYQPDVVLDIAGPQKVEDVRYESLRGGVRVHVVLSEGASVEKDNIETHVRALPYDAVLVFGAADLEELGDLFTKHADFFYGTPIINIDYRARNEHFGTVNLVDITASSVAEVTHELIRELVGDKLPPNIATCLYAGIVAATDSFQSPTTRPRAFELAAQLMNQEADKESVIQHLVKTKPLHLLKLSGRLYARLKHDEYGGIFWSLLKAVDFSDSGATSEDIPTALAELEKNIAGYNLALVLHEETPGERYVAYISLGKGLRGRRDEILQQLAAKRINGLMTVAIIAPNLEEAEKQALQFARSVLP
ncbi:MAG: hypothetical protein HYR90_04150 [Candidatus Andersenbacteria bacterium]|nr:hypothetical protein [Candidatus Andersenbacteria bacterium]MBI3250782.1 hypothetical protein [Candidatus Andersenbacteria bacterium]